MIKKDLSLYLEKSDGLLFKLPIYSDVQYSQTFSEEEIKLKTLHSPFDLISDGLTSRASEGNFSFTIPLMDSDSARVLFQFLFNNYPESFALYYFENNISIKLVKCVLTGLTFNFSKTAIITVSVSGNYSYSENEGILRAMSVQDTYTPLYTYIQGLEITLADEVVPNITGFTLELANNISWLPNQTMHSNGISFPTEYYCDGKVLNGNFTSNQDLNIPSYKDSIPLTVEIKSNNDTFLFFDFSSVIVTTRPELDDIIKKGYDFRITSNDNKVEYKGVNII